ncbi:hypothetical protein ACS0TY_018409 [Phlomoides rotata]
MLQSASSFFPSSHSRESLCLATVSFSAFNNCPRDTVRHRPHLPPPYSVRPSALRPPSQPSTSSICVASPFEVLLCRSSHIAVCHHVAVYRRLQNDQAIFCGEILENERDRASENGTIDGQGGLWHAKKPAIPAPHNKPEQLVLNIDDFGAKAGGISDNFQIRGTIKSFPQMYDFPKRLWIKFEDVTNIDVFGGGTIDGNSQVWWNNSCKIKKTKIAIMGCIVNDPGEMADANFGYVGGAPGKIDLYVGKDPLDSSHNIYLKNDVPSIEILRVVLILYIIIHGFQTLVKGAIAMEQATDTLINLIKEHGRWVDPPAEE